jgi:hypothetical protein
MPATWLAQRDQPYLDLALAALLATQSHQRILDRVKLAKAPHPTRAKCLMTVSTVSNIRGGFM